MNIITGGISENFVIFKIDTQRDQAGSRQGRFRRFFPA